MFSSSKKYIILLTIIIFLISSCHFSVPKNPRIIGIYGMHRPYRSVIGINLVIIGISLQLGADIGIGIYNTPLHISTRPIRYMPHIHIELLPFLRLNYGIKLLIFTIGI